MTDRYAAWAQAGYDDRAIDRADAADIVAGRGVELITLLDCAGRVRRHYFEQTVSIHMLDNVRNGACPEDCGYCGQSHASGAAVRPYKIKPVDQIVAEAAKARDSGAFRYCMALSGRGPSDHDIEHMCRAIERIKAMGLRTCLSAGLLDETKARRLKDAGLDRFNHNLNTSERHYPSICTTHTYADRMRTIEHARGAGLGLCSGMIVGMDETHDDLLDVAYALRGFAAESIPVNFLLPIDGNDVSEPRCGGRPLDPQFVLRVLCMVRLVNPAAEIRIAAGRETHLRSMQAMALWPANSLFVAGYLLTEGDDAAATMRMIVDAGFVPKLDEGDWPPGVKKYLADVAGGNGHPSQPRGRETMLKPTVSARA